MKDYTDFAYFKHENTYKYFNKASQSIDDRTVVFVEDSGKIYTHGGEFGGKTIYNGGDGILINEEDTISINTSWLDSRIREVAPQSDTFELEAATNSKLGGIKIGYTPNGKNYPVMLDSQNNAYVNVPWESGSPSTPSGVPEGTATKDYVDRKLSEAENRLNGLIEEAAGNGKDEGWWQEMFKRYGNQETPEGFDIDKVNNAIVAWAQTESGKNLIVQAFDAREATWKNFVGQEVERQISGSQIKQTVDSISFLVGKFDENGIPTDQGKWTDFIIGLKKDENGQETSFVDIIADQITLDGSVITPELIASKIQAADITIDGRFVANNAEIHGDIYANALILGNGSFAYNPISVTLPTLIADVHREFFIVTQNNTPVVTAANQIVYFDNSLQRINISNANDFNWKQYTLYWLVSDGNSDAANAKWFLIELPLAHGGQREYIENYPADIYIEEIGQSGTEFGAFVSAVNTYSRPIEFLITATVDGNHVEYGYLLNPGEQLSTGTSGTGNIVGDGLIGRVTNQYSQITDKNVIAWYV